MDYNRRIVGQIVIETSCRFRQAAVSNVQTTVGEPVATARFSLERRMKILYNHK